MSHLVLVSFTRSPQYRLEEGCSLEEGRIYD